MGVGRRADATPALTMRTCVVLLLVTVASLDAQQPLPSHPVSGGTAVAPTTVGHVNGVALSRARLDAVLNRLMPFESFHSAVSPEKTKELRQQALESVVNKELQFQEGRRLGVRVPDTLLQQELAVIEKKYGSRAALLSALNGSGATMADLRQEIGRKLTIEEVTRREVTATCTVTPPEASAFFEANPERFIVPEQVHVYALTVGVDPSATPAQWSAAKTRAEDLRRQILAGAAFESVAREHSTDSTRTSGGDMGYLHRGAMLDEFEQAIRSLPLRQPSAVVQSIYGYHIVQVTEVRAARPQTFAEVAPTLTKDLTAKQCEARRQAWLAGLRQRSTIVLTSGPAA